MEELRKQNKDFMSKISDNEKGANEIQSIQNALNKAQEEREIAITEKEEVLRSKKEIQSKLADANKKLKNAQDREEQFNKNYEPKLKSTIEYQK